MRALVVYESRVGATHAVAERIARGLAQSVAVAVVPVGSAAAARAGVDLVVVGAPTHMHGRPTRWTRALAEKAALDRSAHLAFETEGSVEVDGDWLADGDPGRRLAAAFDTRLDAAWSGQASRAIARRLRHHGFRLVADPASFLIGPDDRLVEGEESRAVAWGQWLASQMTTQMAAGLAQPVAT